MKKRISLIALLLALSMIFVLASCETTPKEPAEAIKGAMESSFAEGMNVSADLNVKTTAEGMSMTIPLKANFQTTKDKSVSLMDLTLSVMGMESKTSVYIADKVSYFTVSSMGFEQKYKATEEELKQSGDGIADIFNVTDLFDDEAMKTEWEKLTKDAKAEKADGGTVYTVTIPEGSFKTQVEQDGLDDHRTDSYVKSGTVKLTVDKKGMLTAIDLELTLTDEDTDLSVTGTVKVNDPGKKVEITAPADLDSYPSMDEAMGDPFDTEEDPQDEDYLNAYEAIWELYDEDGNKVEDFDAQIEALKEKYGEETVAEALAEVEALISFFNQ